MPHNCDLDTTGGVLQHVVLLNRGRNVIAVSVSLWFITFAEAFSGDACTCLCVGKEGGRTERQGGLRGSREEKSSFFTKCHGNIVNLLSAAVTRTSPRNEGLIGWLADWPSEWMNGWLADWLADWCSDFPSIHPPASLPVPHSVCVCLAVRPISSLGSVCDWNKN